MLGFRVHTFLAVYEYVNYTKAAEVSHIAQSAMSQHIRYPETFYGVRPFASEGKKIYLIPAGKRLLQASTTLESDEEFLKEVLCCVSEQGSTLRFGIAGTIDGSVISASLAGYIHRRPEANIKVATENTDELPHKLTSREIQFALIEGYYDRQVHDSLVYYTEPFIPVCVVCHQSKKDPEQLEDSLREHLLIRGLGSGTRNILEKNLEIKSIRPGDFAHMTEVGSIHVILQLLEKDLGTTPLYRTAVEQRTQDGIIRELRLKDLQMEHNFAFIWNKDSTYKDEYREICREPQ